MSIQDAWAANWRLYAIREAILVLSDASGTSRRPRTKRERSEALSTITSALREQPVLHGLQYHTRRELVLHERTPLRESHVDIDPDEMMCTLSWSELIAELLDALARYADESLQTKSRSLTLVIDAMRCFRNAMRLCLQHAPLEALRVVVLGYLKHAATWLSYPKLEVLMESTWQCVQDLLDIDSFRALLPAAYLRFWIDACFQQVIGCGPLYRDRPALTSISRRVFVLLATESKTNNILTQRLASHGPSVAKLSTKVDAEHSLSSVGDYSGFGFLLQRACLALHIAKSMSATRRREVEACALAAMSAIITVHALDLSASAATLGIIEDGIPAALSCWFERRHRVHALSFARALIASLSSIAGINDKVSLLKQRVQNELFMVGAGGSRIPTSVTELEQDVVELAASLFPFSEILHRFRESFSPLLDFRVVTSWMRVLYTRISRCAFDVLSSPLDAVPSVCSFLARVESGHSELPLECLHALCMVIRETARLQFSISAQKDLVPSRLGDSMLGISLNESKFTRLNAYSEANSISNIESWRAISRALWNQLLNGTLSPRQADMRSLGLSRKSSKLSESRAIILDTMITIGKLRILQNPLEGLPSVGEVLSGCSVGNPSRLPELHFGDSSYIAEMESLLRFSRYALPIVSSVNEIDVSFMRNLVNSFCSFCDPSNLTGALSPSSRRLAFRFSYLAGAALSGLLHGPSESTFGFTPEKKKDKAVRSSIEILEGFRALYNIPSDMDGRTAVKTMQYSRFAVLDCEAEIFLIDPNEEISTTLSYNDSVDTTRTAVGEDKTNFYYHEAKKSMHELVNANMRRFCVLLEGLDKEENNESINANSDHGKIDEGYLNECSEVQLHPEFRIASDEEENKYGLAETEKSAGVSTSDRQMTVKLIEGSNVGICFPARGGSQACPKGFSSPKSATAAASVLSFLGCYILGGIQAGHFDAFCSGSSTNLCRETNLNSNTIGILIALLQKITVTPVDLLCDEGCMSVLPGSLLTVMEITRYMQVRQRRREVNMQQSSRRAIILCITDAVQTIVDIFTDKLCNLLLLWNAHALDELNHFISPVQTRKPSSSHGRHRKRRREERETSFQTVNPISKDSGAQAKESEFVDCGVEADYEVSTKWDDNMLNERDRGGSTIVESSPKFISTNESELPFPEMDTPSSKVANLERQVDNLVNALQSILPSYSSRADAHVLKIENCLKSLANAELKLGPDYHHRDMLACNVLGSSYIKIHVRIWSMLFDIDTDYSSEIAAEGILSAFKKWKALSGLSHQLFNSYAEEYGFKKRVTKPLPYYLEDWRANFLKYGSRFLESCAVERRAKRRCPDSAGSSAGRRKLIADVLDMGHDILARADTGKSKERTLPRPSRVEALHFIVVALKISFRFYPEEGNSDMSQQTPTDQNSWKFISCFESILNDSDGVIRLAAAGCGFLFFESLRTIKMQEKVFEEIMRWVPAANACEDIAAICGKHGELQVLENLSGKLSNPTSALSYLTVSAKEHSQQLDVLFSKVGACFQGSCVLILIGEIASRSPSGRGEALFEIMSRVSLHAGDEDIAFGVLVRVASLSGYRDPGELFRAHGRQILGKWISSPSSVRHIYSFPGSLLLSGHRERDGALSDWLHENMSEVLPIVVANDNVHSLAKTRELAEYLSLNVSDLVENNNFALYRLYPMHFVESSNSDARRLWSGLDQLSPKRLFSPEAIGSYLEKMISALVMSISAGNYANLTQAKSYSKFQASGFRRDCSRIKAPEYDPIVCALALNRLVGGNEADTVMMAGEDLEGSIFDEKDNIAFANISKWFHRKPVVLARLLTQIGRGLRGPPSPQSLDMRVNTFMSLGMLYLINRETILSQFLLRILLLDLVVCGLEYAETMHNAKWLLEDFLESYASRDINSSAAVKVCDSFYFSPMRSSLAPEFRNMIQLNSESEQRWWEILELLAPALLSIAECSDKEEIVESSKIVLLKLLVGAKEHEAVNAVALLDNFPDGKDFKKLRKLHEEACAVHYKARGISKACLLRYRLWRVSGLAGCSFRHPVTLLMRIKALYSSLAESLNTADDHNEYVWLSDLDERSSWFLLAARALESLSLLITELTRNKDVLHSKFGRLAEQCFCYDSGSRKNVIRFRRLLENTKDEALRCLGILGNIIVIPPSLNLSNSMSVESGPVDEFFFIVQVLLNELRYGCSISRKLVIDTLPKLMATSLGKEMVRANRFPLSELEMFVSLAKRINQKDILSPSLSDPVTGEVLDCSLPSVAEENAWTVPASDHVYHAEEVPSLWVRILAASLAENCNIHSPYRLLKAVCFASSVVAQEMFPVLLKSCVLDNVDNEQFLAKISSAIGSHVLDDRRLSYGGLRLMIQGIDMLCNAGMERLRKNGMAKQAHVNATRRQSTTKDLLYSLQVPYLSVAKAASRCGAYFSALRFSYLHVDFALAVAESDINPIHNPLHEWDVETMRVALPAHDEVSGIVRNSLRHIKEYDGLRAVNHGRGLLEAASDLAAVDSNWSRMLGAYDALQICPQSLLNQNQSSWAHSFPRIIFSREREILRSMLGLGFLNGIGRYWDGLRMRIAEENQLYVNGSHNGYDDDMEIEAFHDLHELRNEAAWKLGSWEKPARLLQQSPMRLSEQSNARYSAGVHSTIYSCLQSIRSRDLTEALLCIKAARSGLGRRMSFGKYGSFTANVEEAGIALRLLEEVEDTVVLFDEIMHSYSSSLASGPASSGYPSSLQDGKRIVDRSVMLRTNIKHGIQSNDRDQDFAEPSLIADSLMTEDYVDERKPLSDGFNLLNEKWTRQDKKSAYYLSSTATHEVSLDVDMKLSLRLALARSLGVENCLARMSADLASRMIATKIGKVAWSGAAAALGTSVSVALDKALPHDRGAWRIAEARLRWHAGEDGSSKQEALRVVKNVISQDLGGSLQIVSSKDSDEPPSFEISWDKPGAKICVFEDIAQLRSDACCLVAKWSASMSAEDPMNLFNSYLRMGLAAFDNAPCSAGKCDAHYVMAEFADKQLKSIEAYWKTEEHNFAIEAMERAVRTVRHLEANLRSSRGNYKHNQAVHKFIRETKCDIDRENDKLTGMKALHSEWQLLSAEHYAQALRTGNRHDLRAAFRLVSLWMKGSNRPELNRLFITASGDKSGCTSLQIPPDKLLPLAPQLASRLSSNCDDHFAFTLSAVFTSMTIAYPSHCLWILVALSNSMCPPPAGIKHGALYCGDKEKKDCADSIIAKISLHNRNVVQQTLVLTKYYLSIAEIPKGMKKEASSLTLDTFDLPHVNDFTAVPVPTIYHPLHGFKAQSSSPYVVGFETSARVLGGRSSPLKVLCIGSDGVLYPQVVKYEDDLRQDAVMEQLFGIVNELLFGWNESARRSLQIRTYRVVPLSPFAGVMQFVRNSEPLRDYLVGDGISENGSAHVRHRPQDMKHSTIIRKAAALTSKPLNTRSKFIRRIWPLFQPVFRYFFLEKFQNPAEWFWRRLAYTRSAAVMSIVGWIIGLGDRHLSNILVDLKTAEIIHIDFGIAFERGKLLPTPEHMPFRLSRDMIDGMGVEGVEGVFRRCCEVTLELLRENKDLLLMVIEVLLHDPLYNWSLSPLKAMQNQRARSNIVDTEGYSVEFNLTETQEEVGRKRFNGSEDGNDKAQHALTRVSEKLDGLEATERLSVAAHVARLIDQARSLDVLSSVYCGWSPWV